MRATGPVKKAVHRFRLLQIELPSHTRVLLRARFRARSNKIARNSTGFACNQTLSDVVLVFINRFDNFETFVRLKRQLVVCVLFFSIRIHGAWIVVKFGNDNVPNLRNVDFLLSPIVLTLGILPISAVVVSSILTGEKVCLILLNLHRIVRDKRRGDQTIGTRLVKAQKEPIRDRVWRTNLTHGGNVLTAEQLEFVLNILSPRFSTRIEIVQHIVLAWHGGGFEFILGQQRCNLGVVQSTVFHRNSWCRFGFHTTIGCRCCHHRVAGSGRGHRGAALGFNVLLHTHLLRIAHNFNKIGRDHTLLALARTRGNLTQVKPVIFWVVRGKLAILIQGTSDTQHIVGRKEKVLL
eukprot:m.172602 g.172602  ORF g.172602 m.172602 type:complete len:350 (-) comp13560_c0_seq1:3420-4469(-)